MTLLITGATGFIGKHLIHRLTTAGHEVYVIVRPSSQAKLPAEVSSYVFDGKIDELVEFLKGKQFDGIIHLASLFLAQHKPEDIPALVQSNVLFSAQLLD